jgi:hypothetical protein
MPQIDTFARQALQLRQEVCDLLIKHDAKAKER